MAQMNRQDEYVIGISNSVWLGRSAIVAVPNKPLCPFGCVYCPHSVKGKRPTTRRRRFVDSALLAGQILRVVEEKAPLDSILIAGLGDPGLYTGLGDLLRRVRASSHLPIAVRTTGVLFTRPSIVRGISTASVIIIKLDTTVPKVFSAIHRPHKGVRISKHLRGLESFSRSYDGRFWVETVLVEGLNDGEKSLDSFVQMLGILKPEKLLIDFLGRENDRNSYRIEKTLSRIGKIGVSVEFGWNSRSSFRDVNSLEIPPDEAMIDESWAPLAIGEHLARRAVVLGEKSRREVDEQLGKREE